MKDRAIKKYTFTSIWRSFSDSHPEYLARHYWWAYLWRGGVWFFDHQPIINAILFGQYQSLKSEAVRVCMANRPKGRLLQLTCAYGSLTPSLMHLMPDDELYLMDVAGIQLDATRKKLNEEEQKRLLEVRMNAEYLAYSDDAFSTILVFFLFHELPTAARSHAMSEVMRVLQPGGRLVIVEYAEHPRQHFLCRYGLLRMILLRLEPFLGEFWHENLFLKLGQHAKKNNKEICQVDEQHFFSGFYRVCVFEVSSTEDK